MPFHRSLFAGAFLILALVSPSSCFTAPSQFGLPAATVPSPQTSRQTLRLSMMQTLAKPSMAEAATPLSPDASTTSAKKPSSSALKDTWELVAATSWAHFTPIERLAWKSSSTRAGRILGHRGDADRGSAPLSFRSPANPEEKIRSASWDVEEDLSHPIERREESLKSALLNTVPGKIGAHFFRQTGATCGLVVGIFAAHVIAVGSMLRFVASPVVKVLPGNNNAETFAPDFTASTTTPSSSSSSSSSSSVSDVLARVKAMEAGASPSPSSSTTSSTTTTSITPPHSMDSAPSSSSSASASASIAPPAAAAANGVEDVLERVRRMELEKGSSSTAAAAAPTPAPAQQFTAPAAAQQFTAPSPAAAAPPAAAPSPAAGAAGFAPGAAANADDIAAVMARLKAMEAEAQARGK